MFFETIATLFQCRTKRHTHQPVTLFASHCIIVSVILFLTNYSGPLLHIPPRRLRLSINALHLTFLIIIITTHPLASLPLGSYRVYFHSRPSHSSPITAYDTSEIISAVITVMCSGSNHSHSVRWIPGNKHSMTSSLHLLTLP